MTTPPDGAAWTAQRYRSLPGVEYLPEELGRIAGADAAGVLDAVRLVRRGEVYDLDAGRWSGMPLFAGHPQFQVVRYRTAAGQDLAGDFDEWRGVNEVHMGFTTEIVSGTVHTGTHLDALCHTTRGPDNSWYGGFTSEQALGDFGPTRAEASSIAPFVTRGVLVDMAAARGESALPAGYVIPLAEFQAAAQAQGVEFRRGDAVLVHTGYLGTWNDGDPAAHKGAGISIEVARYLVEAGAVLVGADNETVEADPSPDPVNPHPVHIHLMVESGVHLLELAWLGDLARDRIHEFLFICLPLRIRGATGSMVRPVAIA
jgi:kynurenine formamidase